MDKFLYYLSLSMPFMWWLVAIFGAWTFWRVRSVGVLLLSLGSLVLAVLGSLAVISGPRMTFGADGEVLSESSGLVPIDVNTVFSAIGLALLVVGVLLVLSKLAAIRRPVL